MRAIVSAAAACVVLVCAPVAAADPGDVDGRVVFIDNPSIVDSHRLPFDSWSPVGDSAVAVHFTTGTPECFGVHATVRETAETVTVDLLGGTLPEALGRACIMIAVFGTLDVPLDTPLGDRTVVSAH